ncbi:MAG: hypothetical protein HC860_13475 [Alkalinema sp. RU_4_3]|nr:hypothetical protein [Alkalinema sp. RU_4_3]
MRMKRWESPRREGRNDKGRKSSARQRQIKKQTQALRLKLKGGDWNGGHDKKDKGPQDNPGGRDINRGLLFV